MKYTDDFEIENERKKNGKGFYIALALCLIAIGGVAVTAFVDTLPKDDPDGVPTPTTTDVAAPTKTAQHVVIPATDVKDDRTTTVPSSTATPTTAAPQELFVFPLSNRVLRAYSDTHVFSETLGEWVTHNGVDFAAENGEQVKAAADGTVENVYTDTLWGDVIELSHDGKLVSRYCGVKATVQKGQTVKAGQKIGTLDTVPAEIVDQPHLHMEMLSNGLYIDPLTLIHGQTVQVK